MEDTKRISSRVLITPELRTDSLRTANPFPSTVMRIALEVHPDFRGSGLGLAAMKTTVDKFCPREWAGRWQDCDFENSTFQIQHSYYWRRGGILKTTKTEASAKPLPMHQVLKQALLEWKTQSHRTQTTDFVFPSRLFGGQKALDLAAVLKRKIRPAFEKLGITGVGWHTFRHTVGTLLAELGEHQLTIRDYLRHSNLSVTTSICKRHHIRSAMPRRDWLRRLFRCKCCPAGKTAETVAP